MKLEMTYDKALETWEKEANGPTTPMDKLRAWIRIGSQINKKDEESAQEFTLMMEERVFNA